MAGGRFELAMQLTAIGLVSLNSNSETHMTWICDARLIYRRGWISPVFISCGPLSTKSIVQGVAFFSRCNVHDLEKKTILNFDLLIFSINP